TTPADCLPRKICLLADEILFLSESMTSIVRSSIVYGTAPGIGGLGQSVSAAITAVAARGQEVFAVGPGAQQTWSLPGGVPDVRWVDSVPRVAPWRTRYTWLRWQTGKLALLSDRKLGSWAAGQLQRIKPKSCYLFTQVALEGLRWAKEE